MLVKTDSEPLDGASLTVQDFLEDISLQFENVDLTTCPIIASADICLLAVSSPTGYLLRILKILFELLRTNNTYPKYLNNLSLGCFNLLVNLCIKLQNQNVQYFFKPSSLF